MTTYSRQQIQEIIAKSKNKRDTSNSPHKSIGSVKSCKKLNKSPSSNKKISQPILDRYQELCEKYRELVEEVKDRDHQYKLQERQIAQLRAERERDKRQIVRLRSLLGFIKKNDYGMQVNMDMQSGGSWRTKHERSTDVEIATDQISPKRSRSPKMLQKILASYNQSPTHHQFNKTASSLRSNEKDTKNCPEVDCLLSPSGSQIIQKNFYKTRRTLERQQAQQKLSNSPYSKLRFTRGTSRYFPSQ